MATAKYLLTGLLVGAILSLELWVKSIIDFSQD